MYEYIIHYTVYICIAAPAYLTGAETYLTSKLMTRYTYIFHEHTCMRPAVQYSTVSCKYAYMSYKAGQLTLPWHLTCPCTYIQLGQQATHQAKGVVSSAWIHKYTAWRYNINQKYHEFGVNWLFLCFGFLMSSIPLKSFVWISL